MASYSNNVVDDEGYGRPIAGALVYVYNRDGSVATLLNGQANPITTDNIGAYSFSVTDGTYIISTRFAGVEYARETVLIGSPPEFKGDKGDTGSADNTYITLATFKASDITRKTASLVGVPGVPDSRYNWTLGNYTGQADDVTIIKANSTALSVGAWVRQRALGVSFTRPGGVTLDLQRKTELRVDIEDFGAVGDGVANDTAAFEAALSAVPNGTTINLRGGATYLLKRTLVHSKAIRLEGASREQTIIRFAADGDYLLVSPTARAAMIFMHPSVQNIVGYNGQALTGYAGRTVLRGVGITGTTGMQALTNGLFIAAPIYVYETDVLSFTANGALVQAGQDQATKGNANGTTFNNVNALGNTLSGFAFIGNDANRCISYGCNAAQNGQYGYYDDSLLGNTFIATEADNNGVGGYFQIATRPAKSAFVAPYSETPAHFSLNPRSAMLGMQGLAVANRAIGAAYFGGLPSGDAYINKGVVYALSETVANVMGGPADPGKALRVSEDGIDWRMNVGQDLTRFTNVDGPNYLSLYAAGTRSASWCAMDVTGNLKKGVQWAIGGIAFGVKSAIMGSGAAAPTTGTYEQGAIFLNDTPTAGGKIGWVCVAAGSPGTWKPYGSIDA